MTLVRRSLTERGRVLVAAGVVLWIASRVYGAPELAMAAVACLALTALAVLHTRTTSTSLDVRRSVHPARLFHGDRGTVEVTIRNTGRLSTATLRLDDAVPPVLAETSRFGLQPVPPGGTVAIRYPLVARQRGVFSIGPLDVGLQDPFGVATRRITGAGAQQVVVFPPVWELPDGLPLDGTRGTSTAGRRAPLESGDEPASVREYVRGDDLRRIHWRSTARRGRLIVRQDEAARDSSATVLLDTRAELHGGTGTASSFECAVASAASFVHHLSRRGFTTRLHAGVAGAPAARGTRGAHLETLATARPTPGADLGPVLRSVGRGAGGHGALVAVLAPLRDSDLLALVRAGRTFASRVAVLVATPTPQRETTDADLAVLRLRAAGWRATAISPGQRLPDVFDGLLVPARTRRAVTP